MKKVVSAFLLAAMMGMALCGMAGAVSDTQTQLPDSNGFAQITIGGAPITVDITKSNVWYETVWLTTEFAITCTAENYADLNIYLNGHLVTAEKPLQLKLDVMNQSTGIEVKTVNTKTQTATVNYVRTVPQTLDLRVSGAPKEDGFYYLSYNSRYLCKMKGDGNFTYFLDKPGASNFRPTIIGDQIYYTYSQQENVAEGWDAGNLKASAHVMNQRFAEIDCIPHLLTDAGMPSNHALDNHEFTMLGKGHYIITAYVVKRVHNIPKDVEGYSPFGARVVAGVFQEIKDGKVVFQWDSTDHPELYGMSADGNDYLGTQSLYADYVHLNSVVIDPADGNYILSLRNTSTILKVSKRTGEILWILGGKGDQFGLSAAQKTSDQHYARISSRGTITVFDNGLVLPEGTPNPMVDAYNTRVVEYKLDEKNKKLISFKEYLVPGMCSPIMGSAELLDASSDTFLIGWGGKRAGTPVFTETNFKTQKHEFEVWSRDGGVISGGSYRVYKATR